MSPCMPWGKYRGRPLDCLPGSYLCWVLEECDLSRYSWLQDACLEELQRRWGVAAPEPRETESAPVDWPALLRRWHRELVLELHPDRGGNVEAMKALNYAWDRLKELIPKM